MNITKKETTTWIDRLNILSVWASETVCET